MVVETDDLDLIEEMFSRLNEAVPLNAAEKRNALGGPMAKAIRDVAEQRFFKSCVSFSDRRYQHREVAVKLLYLEREKKIVDTKKVYLDRFVRDYRGKSSRAVQRLVKDVEHVLERMSKIFGHGDKLLRSQSMAVIYFLIFKNCSEEKWFEKLSRKTLLEFDELRSENRIAAEKDITEAKYDLLEFDRMSVQGTNGALSVKYRFDTMRDYLKKLTG